MSFVPAVIFIESAGWLCVSTNNLRKIFIRSFINIVCMMMMSSRQIGETHLSLSIPERLSDIHCKDATTEEHCE